MCTENVKLWNERWSENKRVTDGTPSYEWYRVSACHSPLSSPTTTTSSPHHARTAAVQQPWLCMTFIPGDPVPEGCITTHLHTRKCCHSLLQARVNRKHLLFYSEVQIWSNFIIIYFTNKGFDEVLLNILWARFRVPVRVSCLKFSLPGFSKKVRHLGYS